MLRLEQVSKIYSSNGVISTGFNKVSLSFTKGEFIAITGESGSGKSTLLNVISGLDSYEEGEMYIMDKPTSGFTREEIEEYRKKYIGNIFQAFNLINSYTVYQNVELVLLMSGYSKEESQPRVNEIIEKVGLAGYEKTRASKLSGGQKQRVAIARALAKETPIIVADEPTGNLDVRSACEIIQLLHQISKDKLVIIVTHNYEQVEPYVTRKIQMHDGQVVEDKRLRDSLQATDQQPMKPARADLITRKNLVRLSARNTFNIPAKFMLLLLVFVFLWAGVFSSYTSSKNMININTQQGYNQFFIDNTPERYVITKKDKSKFTKKDYSKLKSIPNIEKVVKQDLLLDADIVINEGEVSQEENNMYVSVRPQNIDDFKLKLVEGRMPEASNEAIFVLNNKDNAYLEDVAKEMLKTKVLIRDNNNNSKLTKENLKITGYAYTDQSLNNGNGRWVDGLLYASDEVVEIINDGLMKNYCRQMLYFANKEFAVGGINGMSDAGYGLAVDKNVEKGKIYIPEDIAMYSNWPKGQSAYIENYSKYFKKKMNFKIGAVYGSHNCEKLLGTKNYDEVAGYIFMNPDDYSRMFSVGNYQSSVFVGDLKLKDLTEEKLAAAGFDYLSLSDAKMSNKGVTVITGLMYTGSMAGTILVLFLICYFIIKLILKSRNSYFGIVRMLGATRKNCSSMLRWELFIVCNIAFAIGLGFTGLVKGNVITGETIETLVNILTPGSIVLLYAVMVGMSLLLANRYARKMFKESAMSAYREEV